MNTSPRTGLFFALLGGLIGFALWRRLLPRPLEVQTLLCAVPPGASVAAVARHAAELAGDDEAPFAVEFTFNEIPFSFPPGTRAEEIESAIFLALDIRSERAARFSAPGGDEPSRRDTGPHVAPETPGVGAPISTEPAA